MIKVSIKVFADFPRITERVEAGTKLALAEAAIAGHAVASEKAAGVSEVARVPVYETPTGYASGIKFHNFLWKVFNKGSLGKRRAPLKQPGRRKPQWPVVQQHRAYTAHRRDVTGKGIAPRDIINPARTAGRKALKAGIRRLSL